MAEARREGVVVEESKCRSMSNKSELILLLRRTRSLSIMSQGMRLEKNE